MKYIIYWNAGHGETHAEVRDMSTEEAMELAYDSWRQEANFNAEYGVKTWTPELAEGAIIK
jgi:hypothetical protein